MINIEKFTDDLQRSFPAYHFDKVRVGSGWFRIFVLYQGVTLGRINLEPKGQGHEIYGLKFYKRNGDFEPRDRFFYLFSPWLKTGKVPLIAFEKLVFRAKQIKKEKVAELEEIRSRTPKKRRALSKEWMGEFRKLVQEECENFCAEQLAAKTKITVEGEILDKNIGDFWEKIKFDVSAGEKVYVTLEKIPQKSGIQEVVVDGRSFKPEDRNWWEW
jgi:hypothetical protein